MKAMPLATLCNISFCLLLFNRCVFSALSWQRAALSRTFRLFFFLSSAWSGATLVSLLLWYFKPRVRPYSHTQQVDSSTNRHITGPGCYCHWCAAPRHRLPLFTAPQSVMCHVIKMYTFCPSWVCRDPGGKDRRGSLRCEIEAIRLVAVLGVTNGPWSPLRRPQTTPDVPSGPYAVRVADRPERRWVPAWLITTHTVACSSATAGPLPSNWAAVVQSILGYKERNWLMYRGNVLYMLVRYKFA